MAETTVIDWSRVAEPQDDEYDVRVARHCAATRLSPGRGVLYVPPRRSQGPTIFDGQVALAYRYSRAELPSHCADAPLDHPTIGDAVDLLRRWPIGFRHVQAMLDAFHPLLDTRRPIDPQGKTWPCSSHSSDLRLFDVAATVGYPVPLALALVRHAAHQKLRALGVGTSSARALLVDDGRPRVSSWWSDEEVSVSRVLHEALALASEVELLRVLSATESRAEAGHRLREMLAAESTCLMEALGGLRKHATTDEAGKSFLGGLFGWAEGESEAATGCRVPARSRGLGEASR